MNSEEAKRCKGRFLQRSRTFLVRPLLARVFQNSALTQLGRLTHEHEWCGEGRPPCPRHWLAHAFIASIAHEQH